MSGCDPLRVHALHDGTLRGDSRADARCHVAACADCARAPSCSRSTRSPAKNRECAGGYFDALPARITARATRRPRAAWSPPRRLGGRPAAALLIALVTPRLLRNASVAPRRTPRCRPPPR